MLDRFPYKNLGIDKDNPNILHFEIYTDSEKSKFVSVEFDPTTMQKYFQLKKKCSVSELGFSFGDRLNGDFGHYLCVEEKQNRLKEHYFIDQSMLIEVLGRP